MARTTVTSAGLYGVPSNNIFETIDTRTNVGDPRDPADQKSRKFIYNTEPKAKALDFSRYPFVVVEDAVIEPSEYQRADHKTEMLRWKQTITVRSARRGSGGNRDDIGLTDMRAIVNDLLKTFKSGTIKAELRAYYMWDMQINIISVDSAIFDQKGVHETVLELSYYAHLTVNS